MLANLLPRVCFNTLFESRYTLKGRYSIGNVGKTASMSMLALFESRYTLKGRYSIGNVGKTASMSMLTLFESIYTLKGRYSIGNVGKTASMSMLILSLNQGIHWRECTTLLMLAKLLLWVCLLSLNQGIHWREGTILVILAKLHASRSILTVFESRYTLNNRPVTVSAYYVYCCSRVNIETTFLYSFSWFLTLAGITGEAGRHFVFLSSVLVY